jgi:hypothetical protein
MKLPIYTWNEEDGIATCTIVDKQGRVFLGEAHAHPADKDFANEKTGYMIAEIRARISQLQSAKRDILQPQLAALKQLYYSMNRSSEFDPNSYENYMLHRQIRLKEDDLAAVNEEIATYKKFLKGYIDEKDKLYISLRRRRGEQAGKSN